MKEKKKILLGLVFLPLAFILLPFGRRASKPFRLHASGRYQEALRGYKIWISSKRILQKNKGLYFFNSGLLLKYLGEQEAAQELFAAAKKLGIEEDPERHEGNQPFIPKHK